MNTTGLVPGDPIENLVVATVIEVDGTHVIAELDTQIAELSRVYAGNVYPIGQYGSIVRIHCGKTILYGYVSRLRMKAEYEREKGVLSEDGTARIVEIDLFGQGEWVRVEREKSQDWELSFERGLNVFPLPQQRVHLTPTTELKHVYGAQQGAAIAVGEYVGTHGTPAYLDMNELLCKHTAVLGSTGSGKSAAVAAILRSILERGPEKGYKTWTPCIIILDPHNEFSSAFPGQHNRLCTDEGSLTLPYWFLDLQETLALLVGKTEFVATSQSNIIKAALLAARQEGAGILKLPVDSITVDSPVPYRLERLKELITADRPTQQSKQDSHNSILDKLEVLRRDSRMTFLMQEWDGNIDGFADIANALMGCGQMIRVVDLSGIPNEVAGATASAIARLLFQMKLWQTQAERESSPVLLVCEEAHRYVPNRGEAQYAAAQEAIRRLAKEGRKYGIGIMLVSQRPSEVETTVLSQCNTWVVLRITNDSDREQVRSILPDSLSGLTKVLSGLRRREAIVAGQAILLPSRVLIRQLSDGQLPRSHDVDFDKGWQSDRPTIEVLSQVAQRWRIQQR